MGNAERGVHLIDVTPSFFLAIGLTSFDGSGNFHLIFVDPKG